MEDLEQIWEFILRPSISVLQKLGDKAVDRLTTTLSRKVTDNIEDYAKRFLEYASERAPKSDVDAAVKDPGNKSAVTTLLRDLENSGATDPRLAKLIAEGVQLIATNNLQVITIENLNVYIQEDTRKPRKHPSPQASVRVASQQGAARKPKWLAGAENRARAKEQIDPKAAHIVIVDDDPEFRKSVALYFENHGFEVIETSSASEFRACLEDNEGLIDLVILDVNLREPETGYDLLQFVRLRWDTVGTIILTGSEDSASQEILSNQLNAFAFVDKAKEEEQKLLRLLLSHVQKFLRNERDGGASLPGDAPDGDRDGGPDAVIAPEDR